ncbi:MAG TPA: FAD-dependent oxidoreductase [Myxococcota bacterium]|nr:FAD-dependent oxidoreductase [Myxococcota bacterium]
MAQVLIVGAGPAGASLAYLLADRGVEVTLLERQRDFAREFRGEILQPSGVDALQQMGLARPLQAVPQIRPSPLRVYQNQKLVLEMALDPALFAGQPPVAMSQPALLEMLVAEASKRPAFHFHRGTVVRDLLWEKERIVGVRAETEQGERRFHADLVIGADGRASVVRRHGGFVAEEQAPPMDVVWCKLPCPASFRGARAYLGRGHLLIAYQTWDDRLQIAWAILKGTFGALKRHGIEAWVEQMAHHVTPDLAEALRAHRGAMVHPFLLDVVSDRVQRWSAPGVLLIGDAAHTMSPVGGQGLNVALRDALVAANHLVPTLLACPDTQSIDTAARRISSERLPEIFRVQRAQAVPPRVLFSRAWWAEPLRSLLAVLVRTPVGRRVAAGPARLFAFGMSPVRLRV